MSSRVSIDSVTRAVRDLSREAADTPVPSLDWDGLERKLLARIEVEGEKAVTQETLTMARAAPASLPRRVGSPVAMALAAAAAVALIGGGNWSSSGSASDRVHRAAERAADEVQGLTLGDRLKAGDAAESKDRELAYEKRGLVTFTLAPESRIEILASEKGGEVPGPLTISLERGSVHAEVKPQAEGEAFAVEVGRTRVAVHGTSFTVTRAAERVTVEVTHGSVAVGPAGHPGATQGWLLVGPEQAIFSLDGAREAQWLGVPTAAVPGAGAKQDRSSTGALPHAEAPKPTKAASIPAGTQPGHPGHAPAAHQEPSHARSEIAAVETSEVVDARRQADLERSATALILKGLDACYDRQVSSFGVSFSIRSSLTLSILPSGAIREGIFNPPLSPTLISCARQAITSARFPSAASVRQLRIPVTLSRPE